MKIIILALSDVLLFNSQVEDLCHYLLDLSLCDMVCVEFPASAKAAAAIYLSKKILEEEEEDSVWPPSLMQRSSSTDECLTRMTRQLSRVAKVRFQAAREKYASKKYGHISKSSLLKTSPRVAENPV